MGIHVSEAAIERDEAIPLKRAHPFLVTNSEHYSDIKEGGEEGGRRGGRVVRVGRRVVDNMAPLQTR